MGAGAVRGAALRVACGLLQVGAYGVLGALEAGACALMLVEGSVLTISYLELLKW